MVKGDDGDRAKMRRKAQIDALASARLVDTLARANREQMPGATIVLNSFGGSPEHAQYVASVMQSLPMKVYTHNAATVQSAAGIIYLAGRKRIASPEATFVFHPTVLGAGTGTMTPTQMALQQSAIGHTDAAIVRDIAEKSGRTAEETRPLVIGDRIHTAQFGQEFGFVDEVRPLNVSPGAHFFQILLHP